MESLKDLSKGILDSLDGHLKDSTPDQKQENIENRIHNYLQDVFKVIVNIEKTSLNEDDKRARLLELQHKFNVPAVLIKIN